MYTFVMPKGLATSLAFVVGAVAGCLLVFVLGLLEGAIMIAIYRHMHPSSGIGVAAGGIAEASVTLVPVLSGTIAVLLAKRKRRNG